MGDTSGPVLAGWFVFMCAVVATLVTQNRVAFAVAAIAGASLLYLGLRGRL